MVLGRGATCHSPEALYWLPAMATGTRRHAAHAYEKTCTRTEAPETREGPRCGACPVRDPSEMRWPEERAAAVRRHGPVADEHKQRCDDRRWDGNLHRVKTIASLMAEYRQYRQESRRSECLRRKRLARRLGTTMKSMLERRLPGCGEGIVIAKDILNTERGSATAGSVKIG